ncbi:SDR family NAD(P)-dependent oxidoreductase [Kiloniella sp. EL199]|uniref:SDR family NAD(P)-dependent oxidoreductase n=1 Tax=Kiloniella sp. EL199 TaxID=2107581 RepID=UPI000EA19FDC|nr:SDR family NAD(P)-dependent oxidoreductase [Kiloniella sp. EL199]
MSDNDRTVCGRKVLITGATDGVGRITAEKMAIRGATVLVHGRSATKIAAAVEELKQKTGNDQVFGYKADLGSLAEVRDLAEQITSEHPALDVLINNAGLGPGSSEDQLKRLVSQDGYELRLQVNYLATVLLSQLLLPALEKAHGRIINIASAAQSPVQFDDIMLEQGFTASKAYAQSKLAVVIFSLFYAEQVRDRNVTVNALDPGSFLNTRMVKEAYGSSAVSPETGARAHVFLACASELDAVTGQYFDQMKPGKAHEQAYNEEDQEHLWQVTNQLLSGI